MIEFDLPAMRLFMAQTETPDLYKQPYVYRAYSTAGRLLYVGMGTDLRIRMRDHRRRADWWPYAYRFTVETGYPSFRDALKAERRAIVLEQPTHNIHKPSRKRLASGALYPDDPELLAELDALSI